MTGLDHRTMAVLLRAAARMEAAEDLDVFPGEACRALIEVVPCDSAVYNEVNPVARRTVAVAVPEDALRPDSAGVLDLYLDQHPTIRYIRSTGDGSAHKISDFLTLEQWQSLELYREGFAPLGVLHQMSIAMPAEPPLVVGIALNRSTSDFSEEDRTALNLLRPHLAQAYRLALMRTRKKQVASGGAATRALPDLTHLGISARESEVLAVAVSGFTNVEVAEVLALSPATVKKHLENTYRKLRVRGRAEAAAIVLADLGVGLQAGDEVRAGEVVTQNGPE